VKPAEPRAEAQQAAQAARVHLRLPAAEAPGPSSIMLSIT
jgi:hypothetical protein